MANITVIGLWHQGAVLSACLADMGHETVGVDEDPLIVAELSRGRPVVREPKLDAILRRNLSRGRLHYTTSYVEGVTGAEFVFLSIDTPMDDEDRPDLHAILDAAQSIGLAATGDLVLCVTAQVPTGTSEKLAATVGQHQARGRCYVAYVPEFLRLGSAVDTFRRADRFVIGADDPTVAARVTTLLEPLRRPILVTSLKSAEMAKHASNAFLAMSVSFINEIANVCEAVGADALDVARAMKMDRRIGPHAFLMPGIGFAGGTLGRDVRALEQIGAEHDLSLPVLSATMETNRARRPLVLERIRRLHGHLGGAKVALVGLTYKAGTSTLRRSPAVEIARELAADGATVRAVDPLADSAEPSDPLIPYRCASLYEAVEGADVLLIMTESAVPADLDLDRVSRSMRRPVVIDTRNLFDPADMAARGFVYAGVGRGGAGEVSEAPVDRRSQGCG